MYFRYDPRHRIRFELGEVEFDFSNPNICHGSGSGGGTNTVTSSAPPPQVMAAYQTALTAGQNAAAAPLQQYNAPTIAGFTPDQTSAFGTIDAAQGAATPYYNQASSDINAGTSNLWGGVQQFSPSTISQYQNPYTAQVLNSTMAAENNQDAQQQSALQGNAVSAGAWGGDRAGVASAILSGQQDIANNQTNANIENQGFQGAESEFNTQQQAQLGANEANNYLYQQAGLGQANLGSTVESTALSGANAQESSGSVQQQLGQAALNVPYEQFLQQQAYPFQTAQYFANIAEGLGANAGGLGSSSTTAQGPSVGSQVAGFGLGGLGIAGASGAFDSGTTAADTGAAVSARGGRIYAAGGAVPQRMAFGGLAAKPSFGSGIRASTQIPDLSMTFVPSPTGSGSSGGGHGAGGPPSATSAVSTGGQKSSNPTMSDASTVIKAGRALQHYLASPGTADPGTTFSGGQDAASSLDTQSFMADGNPDFASTVNGNFGAGADGANAADPQGAFVGSTGDSTAGVGATTDEGGISYAGTNVGGGSGIAGGADAGSVYGGGNAGVASGAFGTGTGTTTGAAGASSAGTGAGGALNAAAPAATADAAAGAATTDTAATAITADATSTLGAGTLAGAVDGATVEAAVDGAITDAAAGVVGDSLASYAPLMLLLAKRGGRIEPKRAFGSRKGYDDGGAVPDAPPQTVGGQTPMQAGTPTQAPVQQIYNSSYQNMSPEQLQQILTRLPAGSPQQKSAQAVLNTKRMMPNVGQAAQGGLGSQQSSQGYAGGGDVPATPGGMFSGDGGIQLDGPPPLNQSMIPSASGAPTALSQALMNTTANAVKPAGKPNMSIPPPPSADQLAPTTGGFGTQQAGPDADITVTGGDKVASNETPPSDSSDSSDAAYDPNGKAKHIEANPWLALAKAGFTAAAGQSPNALTNLGKGAETGVSDYEAQKIHADSVNEAADKLMNEAKQHKESLAVEQQKADEAARHNLVAEDQAKAIVVPGMFGSSIYNTGTHQFQQAPGGISSGGPQPGSPENAWVDQQAQAAVDGKIPITPYMKTKDPKWNLVEQAAISKDPNYNDRRYPEIQKFNNDPQMGGIATRMNAAAGHVKLLSDLSGALDTGDQQQINEASNKVKTAFGLSSAPNNVTAVNQLVSSELLKATLGDSGALEDRANLQARLSPSLSPKILKSTLDNGILPAIKEQLKANEQRYIANTGMNDYRTRYLEPATVQGLGLNPAPNTNAIRALQADPSKAKEFEKHYGVSASRYLGGQ